MVPENLSYPVASHQSKDNMPFICTKPVYHKIVKTSSRNLGIAYLLFKISS